MKILKKIVLLIEKQIIKLLKLYDRNFYNMRFNQYLNHIGINLIGEPGFISDDLWIDTVDSSLITIEEGVIISKGVTLLCHDYSIQYPFMKYNKDISRAVLLKKILLRKKCFIGANVTILPGTIIGENTIVGAGSVVKGNIPDNVVVAGNPAKFIENVDDYYKKLNKYEKDSINFGR